MHALQTAIDGVLLLQPTIYNDTRGYFFEAFNQRDFNALVGTDEYTFVQDNQSKSSKNVLRGLHYQVQKPQGKLVRTISGSIFDVAVDLRKDSPTFGKHVTVTLSSENKRMLWVPPGFAHGFLVLSGTAEILYKTTEYYAPEYERCLLWNDAALAIPWRLCGQPILSDKDSQGKNFTETEF